MKALIVDPSDTYRQLLAKVLENFGFQTINANGYSDACNELNHHSFNLICMAMNLADGNSSDLCEKLKSSEETAKTPLLMLTSSKSDEAVQNALALGVTEVFNKQDFNSFSQYLSNLVKRLTKPTDITGHILYIEDSLSLASMVSEQLSRQGYTIEHHSSAMPAIRAFNNKDFDLILTDVVLGGSVGGLQIVRAVRQNADEHKRNIPILATSGYDDKARKLELFHLGINDYIPKPIVEEEMFARVKNLLSNRQLILKLEMQQKRLETLAMTDQLTGLYNRHFFMDMAPKKIAQAQRHKHPLCLMVIDIDHFKSINDTHGHAKGDTVLTAIGDLLVTKTRREDIVARYGGEEFILLMEYSNIAGTRGKAEALRLLIASLTPIGIATTASFGISCLLPDDSFADLFARADKALYQAKEEGRNRIAVL